MGGPERVKRQHDGGRLTIRERIERLTDPDSFREIGAVSGLAEYDENGELKDFTAANCVFSRARVEDGRSSWWETISRCAAVRPTPPSAKSR